MSRVLKKVTKTVFEPGTYSSHPYRRSEDCVDVYLPAPKGPFNVLRFKIGCASDERTITVYFGGPAEIGDVIAADGEDTP